MRLADLKNKALGGAISSFYLLHYGSAIDGVTFMPNQAIDAKSNDMPKKAEGGPRNSVFSVRLPAKLRFGIELISRRQRIPMTDVIVEAIADALGSENSGLFVDLPGEDLPVYLLARVWDDRESVRLVKLALVQPNLLTGAEAALWARIRAESRYWDGNAKKDALTIDDLRADRLEADWPELNAAA